MTKNTGPRNFIGEKIDELKKLDTIFQQHIQQYLPEKEAYQQLRVNEVNTIVEDEYQQPRVEISTTEENDDPPELVDEDEDINDKQWN